MARKQTGERGVRVTAYLPREVAAKLEASAKASGETLSHALRRAVEQAVDHDRESPAPSLTLAAPERSASLPAHPRIQAIVEQLRAAGGDRGRLEHALELTQAVVLDTLERIGSDADAMRAWAEDPDEAQPPATLTDPAAIVPLIECWRKVVLTIHQIRLVDAMTRDQVLRTMERFGSAATAALKRALVEMGMDEGKADDIAARFASALADRAGDIVD